MPRFFLYRMAGVNTPQDIRDSPKRQVIHRSTITREYQRGIYMHRNSDWTETERYSSDLGQKKHEWEKQAKGRDLKIGGNTGLAERIEEKIIKEKRSPEAALAELDADLSVSTLYRYIDHGIFLKLTNKDLPVKGKKKRAPVEV